MTISSIRALGLILMCIFLFNPLGGQDLYEIGILPKLNVNVQIDQDYSLNFKMERRDFLVQGMFEGASLNSYQHELMDYSIMAVRGVGLKNRMGFGYLIRNRRGTWHHRITQQFVLNTLTNLKLSHRWVFDQTFVEDQSTYRLRYRSSISKALNGEVSDANEFYLKLGAEWLNILKSGSFSGEFRILPTFGYMISDHNKVELGLDYRLGGFFDDIYDHSLYIAINWYYRI